PLRLAEDPYRHRAAVCRAVSEFAVRVTAPTVHRAAGRATAGVGASSAHRSENEAARDWCGDETGTAERPRTELAAVVGSPAVRGAGGRDPAGVSAPRAHHLESQPTGYREGSPTINRRAVAELARVVRPPAVRGAAGRKPAGVDEPCAHRREGEPARHQHRCRPVRDRATAALAAPVRPPDGPRADPPAA